MNKKQMYVLLAGCLASISAHAQKNPDIVADEVVVTATRFEEKSSDQPVNVQIINAAQIRESGALTLPELLSQQAGIYTRDASGNPNRQIDMRGFGVTGDQNSLILLDGQRISENEQASANLTGIPLSSIDRIEIVRGSGGAVLYGAGASGGTINIITKGVRAGTREAYVRAGGGSYGTSVLAAGGKLAGDKVGLTIDADTFDTNNYRENNSLTQNNLSIGASYFGDRGPVTLKFTRSGQDLRLPGARTEAQLETDRRGTSTPANYGSLDTDTTSLTTTQSYDFGQLGLDANHRERHNIAGFGTDSIDTHGRVTEVSPRIKLPFQIFGRNNALIVGLDWERWDYDSTAVFGGFPSSTVSAQENRAVYVKDTFDLATRTILSIGGREQRSDTNSQDAVGFTPEQEQNKTLHAYDIALKQGLNDQLSVYGRVGRSFRMANVDDNRFRTTLLNPQTSNDQELGAEVRLDRASLRVAAYRMKLENEIMFIPVAPFTNVNLPPTERKGLELETNISFSETLALNANYTLTIAKFRDGNFGGVDVSGNYVALVPKHRANASLTWKPIPRTTLTTRVSYVGEQYFDNDQRNTFGRKMPDYTVTDLIARYDIGNWRLGATIYNLFNKKYFTYGIVGGASFSAYPEAERSFLISAEYHFGQ